MSVGNASLAPRVKALRRLTEDGADDARANLLDQGVMGVELAAHAAKYQRSVYISRGQSFIGVDASLRQTAAVEYDKAFGDRLRALIKASGFKNPRRYAIDGLERPADSGPQRLNNYLKGRVPDVETARIMAESLNVTAMRLYGLDEANTAADVALIDILRHLLSLEGISADKADTIASASLAAQRLLQRLPDDDPIQIRVKYAAKAAWHQQQMPEIGKRP